jgi:hypothetical protein
MAVFFKGFCRKTPVPFERTGVRFALTQLSRSPFLQPGGLLWVIFWYPLIAFKFAGSISERGGTLLLAHLKECIGFQIKILDCVIGRNPRQRTYQYALLGFLPLALPKSLSKSL